MTCPFMELAADLERIKSPDRRMDCRLWLLYGDQLGDVYHPRGRRPVKPSEIIQGRWFGSAFEKYPEDVDGVADNWRVPAFTTSTDAARLLYANMGYVVWAPLGKRPSVATEDDGGWSEYSQGFNEATAMSAAVLRAWSSRRMQGAV